MKVLINFSVRFYPSNLFGVGSFKVFKELSDKKSLDREIVELLFDNYNDVDQFVREKQHTAKEYYKNIFMKFQELLL